MLMLMLMINPIIHVSHSRFAWTPWRHTSWCTTYTSVGFSSPSHSSVWLSFLHSYPQCVSSVVVFVCLLSRNTYFMGARLTRTLLFQSACSGYACKFTSINVFLHWKSALLLNSSVARINFISIIVSISFWSLYYFPRAWVWSHMAFSYSALISCICIFHILCCRRSYFDID